MNLLLAVMAIDAADQRSQSASSRSPVRESVVVCSRSTDGTRSRARR